MIGAYARLKNLEGLLVEFLRGVVIALFSIDYPNAIVDPSDKWVVKAQTSACNPQGIFISRSGFV